MGSDAAMSVAFFISAAAVAWAAAFAWAKWLGRPKESQALPGDVERRLRSLEIAVESVAVEVERIGEAQRYTTRLIDERLPAPVPSLPRESN